MPDGIGKTKAHLLDQVRELSERVGHLESVISGHRRSEELLWESERKSRAWLEHSPVCTKIVDLDFNLQFMSDAGVRGLRIDDITQYYGKPYPFEFYPEAARDRMTGNLKRVKATGEIATHDASVVDQEGNTLWFHSTLVPVNDDEGRIDYIIVVSIDITERKQAEEALRKSEQRYREIFDESLACIWEADYSDVKRMLDDLAAGGVRDLRKYFNDNPDKLSEIYDLAPVIDISRATCEVYGAPNKQALIESTRAELESDGELHGFLGSLIAFMAGEVEFEYDSPDHKFDGTPIVTSCRHVIPPQYRHDWSRVLCSIDDITERRRANEALKESEQRYKNLYDSAQVSIWNEDFSKVRQALNQLRRDGVRDLRQYLGENERAAWDMAAMVKVNDVNQATLKLFNAKSKEEFLESIHKTFGAGAIDVFANELCAIWEGKGDFRSEAQFQTLDGKEITAIISLPIPDTDEGYRSIPVSILDITERKQAEESSRQLIAAIDALQESVTFFDADDRLVFSNKRHREINSKVLETSVPGAAFEDQMKALLAHGLVPEARGREDEWLRERLERHRSPRGPFEMLRQDGIRLLVHEQRTPEGGMITLATDITELKAIDEQLRQAQKMEAVGQLTGGVAHDFNNLLAVIQGNAELLSEQLGREDRSLDAILRATSRGAELTQRLLAFSRRQSLRPRVIDLGGLVSGMTEMLTRTLGETIVIETAVAPKLDNALADPGQVESALLNLALNARDAMPKGGKLTIGCRNANLDEAGAALAQEAVAGDYVVLAVSDTGCGMSGAVRARAFEPFFSTKGVGQGSGLGLSMVYGFAQQSGGHVTIESEEGRGTTVKLHLVRAEGAFRPEAVRQDAGIPRGRGEMILVIEDDRDVRAMAGKMLESMGYRVLAAADAARARSALDREKKIDLVLSDVVLPGGTSGPEFAAEVRASHPGLPIIFMSGYPREAATGNGFLGSGRVLLSKPFQMEQLAEALHEALD